MKVYEGSIITCDAQDHVYRFLVEDGGRILYVGNELPAKYASYTRIALGQRTLIPAFGDSHIHFASFATFYAGLNVSQAKSNAEILDRNPLETDVSLLDTVRVEQLLLGGEPYRKLSQNPIGQVLKGMTRR